MRTLFSMITVMEARGRKVRAVELLALYFQQRGGIKMHDDEAEQLRTRLQHELPADTFERAFQRGTMLDFQQVLAELLTMSQQADA